MGRDSGAGSEWRETVYGPVRSDFADNRLADLCDPLTGIQTGPFGSQLHQKDYVSVGTPIITVEHLGENRILHDAVPRVSEQDRSRLSKYALQKGDIVFSRVGSVDRRALVRTEEAGWLFSGRCLRIRPNPRKIDTEFLSYFFGTSSFKNHVRAIAVGATMPSLNTQLLSDIRVPHPTDINEQRTIAHILGTLDDKIELNRRMNETLEEMARALFKSWFVEFDPVHAKAALRNHTPNHSPLDWTVERAQAYLDEMDPSIAALFPDRFVDSEVGAVPEGWEVKTLGEVIELAYGKALKAAVRKGGAIPVYGANGQVGWHDKKLATGPGIIVGRKGNPGVITWVQSDFFPIDTTFYVVPKEGKQSLYFLFYALERQGLADLTADSAVPGLNRNLAYMNKLLIPDRMAIVSFNDYAKTLFARRHQLEEETRTLAALRDTLLPKLISGELRVKDSGRFLESVS